MRVGKAADEIRHSVWIGGRVTLKATMVWKTPVAPEPVEARRAQVTPPKETDEEAMATSAKALPRF